MKHATVSRFFSRIILTTILIAIGGAAGAAEDETASYLRSHYTKFEYRIPVRDGVKLFTAVYTPNDTSKTYPILLTRTPYSAGPYGADRYTRMIAPSPEMVKAGYIFVIQDVRGRCMSEGEFVNMRPHIDDKRSSTDVDESSDTYDTIEWLLANFDNHNGRVGLWGLSYGGFYSSAGMIDSHPALKLVSPQAPIADWFWDDMHHHGAFILPLAFNFFSSFGQARPEPTTERPERFDHGTPDGYQFFLDLGPLKNANDKHFNNEIAFWNEIVAHPNYDSFWQSRNIIPHLKNIKTAVVTVGGLFDTEDLYGPLKTYRAVEENNPGIFNVLVMGPWSHGGWLRSDGDSLGEADFGFKTAKGFREQYMFPMFEHFLRGTGEHNLPEALVFETGANRWRSFDKWPPAQLRQQRLYLQANSELSFSPPAGGKDAFDAYVSDPAKPVPYTMEITTRWARNYMTEDQRFAARRPDVLVYRSQVLEDDLTLAGPIIADLWVATSGTAADWIVKVIDLYPDRLSGHDRDSDEPDLGGTQRLVRAEVFRSRFRNSYAHPEPMVADQLTNISYEIQDLLHTFKRGHRIMVQIQSTWFPFVDRNPQRYVPNIFEAEAEDFISATHRVYRSSEHPTSLLVGVL
jgi:putative CocE/NonD family hydrolase